MVNFFLRKMFRANSNIAISLAEVEVIVKLISLSAKELLYLDFHRNFP